MIVVNVVLENYGKISTTQGIEKSADALEYIAEQMSKSFGISVYHSKSNMLSVFINKSVNYEENLLKLNEILYKDAYVGESLVTHIDVLDLKTYSKDKTEAFDLINFMGVKRYGKSCHIEKLNEELKKKKYRTEKIEKILDNAVKNDLFSVAYQPIF